MQIHHHRHQLPQPVIHVIVLRRPRAPEPTLDGAFPDAWRAGPSASPHGPAPGPRPLDAGRISPSPALCRLAPAGWTCLAPRLSAAARART